MFTQLLVSIGAELFMQHLIPFGWVGHFPETASPPSFSHLVSSAQLPPAARQAFSWYGRDMQHFTEADCVGHLPERKFLPGHLDVERQKPPIPRQGSSLYENALQANAKSIRSCFIA